MSVILKNNVEGFLATTISASDVSLVLQPGDGAAFPNPVSPDYFYATLVSTGGTVEVVRVTARAGDTLSILRGQDGTTANSFAAGSRLEMRVNAQSVIDTVYSITNYQGGSASNPTTRLDGSALQAGDFYFNTSADEVRFYNGAAWQSLTTGSIDVQNFVGNGTQTTFTLSQAPTGEDNTQVYIKGVYQQKDTYSISGLSLIFSTAPPAGTTIEVVTLEAIAIGQTSADLVSYQPAGVAAVPTTVREKLRETVSVKDFGAVGDGVADDTAAIQAAYDYLMTVGGGTLYIPGTPNGYKLNSALDFTGGGNYANSFSPIKIKGDGVVDIPDTGGIYATTLLANTGLGTACIDIVGHENVFFEDIKIDGTNTTICTTPSRIGILAGRDTGGGAFGKDQWHIFKNLAIFLPTTNDAANPSIALYNVATEIGTYENCTFFADLPHGLVANNNTANVNYNVSSAFVTLDNGPDSCSVNTYIGCIFSSTSALVGARAVPVLHLDACYSNSFINCYFGDTGTTATASQPVIKLTGGTVKDIHFLNFVNEATGDLFGGTVQNLRYNKFIGHNNAFNSAYALAKMSVGIMIHNDFDISESDSASGSYDAYRMTLGVGGNPFFGNSNKFNLCVHGDFYAEYAAGAITGAYRTSWEFKALNDFPSQNITFNGGTAGMDVWTMNGNQMTGLLLQDGQVKSADEKTIDTTPSVIATIKQSAAMAFVQVFNNVGGDTGWFLIAWNYTGGTATIIDSDNQTGLTFTFSTSLASNDLTASVAAGSATAYITLMV